MPTIPDNLAKAYGLALGGALGPVLSLVNSFKKVISPPLVLAFAVVEGVFVGAFSKVITIYVGGDVSIVYQAILGTVGAPSPARRSRSTSSSTSRSPTSSAAV
ncbi:MAG: Bax inhibitor-1/YccA family protein [Nocardioidaceae bacterium]